jgi:hypothetical protein
MDVQSLRKFLVAVLVLGFVALYFSFLASIWSADDGLPPRLDDALVGLAAVFSGALGTAFAVALGAKETRVGLAFSLPKVPLSTLLLAGVWVYALVGIVAVVTFALNVDETPDSIRALALVIVGYVAAIVTNAYKAVTDPQ